MDSEGTATETKIYKSLALHNAACNPVFYEFQDCETEHPFRRFFGWCKPQHSKLVQCIKDERNRHTKLNNKLAREHHERLRQKALKEKEEALKENKALFPTANMDPENVEPVEKRLKSADSAIETNECDVAEEKTCVDDDAASHASETEKLTTEKSSELANSDSDDGVSDGADESEDSGCAFPPDEDVVDMLRDVELDIPFPTVTDRYLTPYYKVNVQKPGDDICVWIHSNRICMISLAPSHNVLRNGNKISKVDFKVSNKLDRASNKVSGKSKHGAQPLQQNSNICAISCTDGQTQMIKCCLIGKLVEVNESLLENPELLREQPHKGGYLAIVLPNIKVLDKIRDAMLTKEQYEAAIKMREKNIENEDRFCEKCIL